MEEMACNNHCVAWRHGNHDVVNGDGARVANYRPSSSHQRVNYKYDFVDICAKFWSGLDGIGSDGSSLTSISLPPHLSFSVCLVRI